MNIAERLKGMRKSHGLKLREVSEKTGLSISYISDLERGRQNPSLETCRKFSVVYKITLSQMFDDADPKSGITQRALDVPIVTMGTACRICGGCEYQCAECLESARQ